MVSESGSDEELPGAATERDTFHVPRHPIGIFLGQRLLGMVAVCDDDGGEKKGDGGGGAHLGGGRGVGV